MAIGASQYLRENPETKKERAERKAIWIAKATAHFDNEQIRQEASDIFEKANPLPTKLALPIIK